MKMGAAKQAAGRAAGLITVTVPNVDETVSHDTFHFALDREKLRTVRRREGRYLLRTNRDGYDWHPSGPSLSNSPRSSRPSKN